MHAAIEQLVQTPAAADLTAASAAATFGYRSLKYVAWHVFLAIANGNDQVESDGGKGLVKLLIYGSARVLRGGHEPFA